MERVAQRQTAGSSGLLLDTAKITDGIAEENMDIGPRKIMKADVKRMFIFI